MRKRGYRRKGKFCSVLAPGMYVVFATAMVAASTVEARAVCRSPPAASGGQGAAKWLPAHWPRRASAIAVAVWQPAGRKVSMQGNALGICAQCRRVFA